MDGHVFTGEQIPQVRLLVLRQCLKLEMKGLRRRGPSARGVLAKMFGMRPRASAWSVLQRVNEEIAKFLPPAAPKAEGGA